MGAVFGKRFEQYFLSNQEVDELIKKGLLCPEIKQPRLVTNSNGEYVEKGVTVYDNGVKAAFVRDDLVFEAFYLTDFHFIYVESNRSAKATFNRDKGVKWTYTCPDVIHVIPLELVDEISIDYGKTYSWIQEGKTVEKQKNVIAGAAVGAVVAGPVGAVVGSIANSGTKKVTTPTLYHKNTTYNLNICINGEGYSVNEWYTEYKTNSNYFDKQSYSNKEAKQLIARAKEGLSEKEKIKIVKETMVAQKKVKRENTIATIICGIFIIAIIFLFLFIIGAI